MSSRPAETDSSPDGVTGLHDTIATAMPALSHLECSVCGHRQRVGDVGGKLRGGWPKCCGYTMTLWTMRQVDAGEVAPFNPVAHG